jgi:hypothetical protein
VVAELMKDDRRLEGAVLVVVVVMGDAGSEWRTLWVVLKQGSDSLDFLGQMEGVESAVREWIS